MVIDLDDFRAVNETHGPRVGDALLGRDRPPPRRGRRSGCAGGPAAQRRVRRGPARRRRCQRGRASGRRLAGDRRSSVHLRGPLRPRSPPASASPSARAATRPTSCCARPARRPARPSAAAATASPCGARRRLAARTGAVWSSSGCSGCCPRAASASTTSRSSTSAADALVGAEALLRIRDREDELLNPAEFVEAAESSGLLLRLGTQMLEATCEQLSQVGCAAAQPGSRPRVRQRVAPPAGRPGPGHPGRGRPRGQRHRAGPAVARGHREHARRPQRGARRAHRLPARPRRQDRPRRVRRRILDARLPQALPARLRQDRPEPHRRARSGSARSSHRAGHRRSWPTASA